MSPGGDGGRRAALCTRLGYKFLNAGLLETALTHRSYGGSHNERLEFLGDGVLNFLVAELLYRRHPGAPEGVLSRMRASIVRGETLAQAARSLALGPCLRLGGGELKSGGDERDSILADAIEAVLGAVYLDGGLDAAREFVEKHLGDTLAEARPDELVKDPKSRLQEYLQQHAREVPRYDVVEVSGAPHAQHFVVECIIEDVARRFKGEGASRRSAEQQAARRAYCALADVDQRVDE